MAAPGFKSGGVPLLSGLDFLPVPTSHIVVPGLVPGMTRKRSEREGGAANPKSCELQNQDTNVLVLKFVRMRFGRCGGKR